MMENTFKLVDNDFEYVIHDFLNNVEVIYKDKIPCKERYDLMFKHIFMKYLEENKFDITKDVMSEVDGRKFVFLVKEFENIFRIGTYEFLAGAYVTVLEKKLKKNKR